ncbi:MAG: hypothetical protein H7645_02330 [Candidatus Heimdallarchaeota archaeon]|nr:hypothetical protein [Candidatus Heimdallarchaeota archaeon]MCK4769153.1 hypothetical protein [Candidatus Heimdallarchaeota archaeon]
MVSVAFISMIAVFALLMVVGIVFFTIFLFKIIIQFKEKTDIPSTLKSIDLKKSIYERMADDSEATEQYVYMRRKLMGG